MPTAAAKPVVLKRSTDKCVAVGDLRSTGCTTIDYKGAHPCVER